jgi:hypothetical protein
MLAGDGCVTTVLVTAMVNLLRVPVATEMLVDQLTGLPALLC